METSAVTWNQRDCGKSCGRDETGAEPAHPEYYDCDIGAGQMVDMHESEEAFREIAAERNDIHENLVGGAAKCSM